MRILPFDAQRFVPQLGSDAQVLGVVQRGLETGALARLPNGSYVQVNGDILQPLNPTQVETAMRAAQIAPEALGHQPLVLSAAPRVTVKRRKVLQRSTDERQRRSDDA